MACRSPIEQQSSIGYHRDMELQRRTISTVDYQRLENAVRAGVSGNLAPRPLLSRLMSCLEGAEVVEPAQMPPGVVTMNSTVRLRPADESELETYTLVYPSFSDIAQGRLSILTPIGIAILGCRVGDEVESEGPLGTSRLRIEDVTFQPESAGLHDV